MGDDLKELKEVWEAHARHDPLWAILSDPERSGRRWKTEHFFRTGGVEVGGLMSEMGSLRRPARFERALDFGCGVGRVSQALCRHFRHVVGVDISPTMVRLARRFNRFGPRCFYLQNESGNLAVFKSASFDLVYSNIVLQHVPPPIALEYVRDFLRIVRSDGLVVFQLPSHRIEAAGAEEPPTAMPEEAYRGSIRLCSPAPRRMRPGETNLLCLEVTNLSTVPWTSSTRAPVRCGNHWLSASDLTPVVWDQGRASLPPGFQPGTPVSIRLTVTAPVKTGRYVCEVDLVHELISWFSVYGSPTLRFEVDVSKEGVVEASDEAARSKSAEPDDAAFPDLATLVSLSNIEPEPYAVHGIPEETIVRTVEESGGHVLEKISDWRSGGEWVAYLYFVSPD